MTTIACNHEMMAADSQVTDGNIKEKCIKIFKVNGDIIGIAGSYSEGLAFVRWWSDKEKEKPSFSETEAIVLKPDGTIERWDGAFYPMAVKGFQAIGSGSNFALGAMEMGADPKKAVQVACKYDCYSCPPVRVKKV